MTMKKIFSLILVLGMFLSSCGTANYVNGTDVDVYGAESIPYVLSNYYPGLYEYYTQGVLRVTSIREITLADGTIDYNVKYKFVKYYYNTHAERMEVVKELYPELYQMYLNGVIDINSVYKYVDRSTGRISYKVSYNRIYDYYNYYYSPGYIHRTRPYYRPPMRYSPAPRVRPNPRPTPPPANRPPQRPNVRPNNPQRPNTPPPQNHNHSGGNNGGRPTRR